MHFIAVPRENQALAKCFAETHKRYTRMINFRQGWRGYLWQGWFHSFPMCEPYLHAAVRYVERNPVAAGIVRQAHDSAWSSARAHVLKTADPLHSRCYLEQTIADWAAFLQQSDGEARTIEGHLRTGRPLGDEAVVRDLGERVGRTVTRKKPGPKTSRGVRSKAPVSIAAH